MNTGLGSSLWQLAQCAEPGLWWLSGLGKRGDGIPWASTQDLKWSFKALLCTATRSTVCGERAWVHLHGQIKKKCDHLRFTQISNFCLIQGNSVRKTNKCLGLGSQRTTSGHRNSCVYHPQIIQKFVTLRNAS